MNSFQILEGDALEVLQTLPAESVDSLVTDPPAGISFMGKEWDHHRGGRAAWCEAFASIFSGAHRVLKPGAHGLVWALPRTSHWTATALEDAGFEIRDRVSHLFGTGFPKSLDVSKALDKAAGAERARGEPGRYASRRPRAEVPSVNTYHDGVGNADTALITAPATDDALRWAGWGTALKPACEDWWLVRKPLVGTVAANVIEHGTGALNIDGCRVGATVETWPASRSYQRAETGGRGQKKYQATAPAPAGRWPANVVFSHHPECELVGKRKVAGSNFGGHPEGRINSVFGKDDRPRGAAGYADPDGFETVPDYHCHPDCPVRMLGEQAGDLPSGGTPPRRLRDKNRNTYGAFGGEENPSGIGGSKGTASRFFYCAKPSTAERNVGLHGYEEGTTDDGRQKSIDNPYLRGKTKRQNRHPTVKAAELMQYLCRLVTPPGGTVLDPFCGSGSTGIAALREGFTFVGIEREAEYAELARARIIGDAPLLNRESAVSLAAQPPVGA